MEGGKKGGMSGIYPQEKQKSLSKFKPPNNTLRSTNTCIYTNRLLSLQKYLTARPEKKVFCFFAEQEISSNKYYKCGKWIC